jgi:hypothetical protein
MHRFEFANNLSLTLVGVDYGDVRLPPPDNEREWRFVRRVLDVHLPRLEPDSDILDQPRLAGYHQHPHFPMHGVAKPV